MVAAKVFGFFFYKRTNTTLVGGESWHGVPAMLEGLAFGQGCQRLGLLPDAVFWRCTPSSIPCIPSAHLLAGSDAMACVNQLFKKSCLS